MPGQANIATPNRSIATRGKCLGIEWISIQYSEDIAALNGKTRTKTCGELNISVHQCPSVVEENEESFMHWLTK